MAKTEYRVLTGIDYPPNKRAEIGDVVSDLPKDSIPWLIEGGIVERIGEIKMASQKTKHVFEETQPITIVEEEVEDEL